MITRTIFITEDGKEFENSIRAKQHECELSGHRWNYYKEDMILQQEKDNDTKVKFCKKCSKQELIN